MEFLLVPLLFSAALFLLSIGKVFGGKEIHGSCKTHNTVNGVNMSCGACSTKDSKLIPADDHAGLQNVAKLGYPSRKRQFYAKADFKPERFN